MSQRGCSLYLSSVQRAKHALNKYFIIINTEFTVYAGGFLPKTLELAVKTACMRVVGSAHFVHDMSVSSSPADDVR